MTQDAVVIRLLPNNMAEVAVTRATACGGNCGSCESCMFQSELHTEARNLIQAKPGQKVTIETRCFKVAYIPEDRPYESSADILEKPVLCVAAIMEYELPEWIKTQ